jgi:uncharacterized membrane protein YeaQ/YmgE (transglycosylase-associated protein family)
MIGNQNSTLAAGVVGTSWGTGLHDIWGMSSPTAMAVLSLAVVAAYAVLLTVVAFTVFNRATVQ